MIKTRAKHSTRFQQVSCHLDPRMDRVRIALLLENNYDCNKPKKNFLKYAGVICSKAIVKCLASPVGYLESAHDGGTIYCINY